MNCTFCDIVEGKAPADIRFELPDSLVIVPLNPVAPGHRIAIPRVHVSNFSENPATTAAVMRDVAELMALTTEIDCNIITSRGKAATQTVFHLHVHIVPRFEGDGLRLPWTEKLTVPWKQRMDAELIEKGRLS